jgi:Flp pilus assembly protein TadD
MYLPLAAVILLAVLAVWGIAQRLPVRPEARAAALSLLTFAIVLSAALATWLRNGDYRDMETLYRTSIAGRPTAVWPRVLLGNALYARHSVAEGVEQFRAAAQLSPRDPKILTNLGVGLALLNQVGDATVQFALATELDPADASLRANYGRALARLGRRREAAEQLERSLLLDPAQPFVNFDLAEVHAAQGHTADAERYFTTARDLARKLQHADLAQSCEVRLARLRGSSPHPLGR